MEEPTVLKKFTVEAKLEPPLSFSGLFSVMFYSQSDFNDLFFRISGLQISSKANLTKEDGTTYSKM